MRLFRAATLSPLTDAGARWLRDGAPALGASIAFYAMFALAPLLLVVTAIAAAVFGEAAARGQIVQQIQGVVGPDAARALEAMIGSAWRHPAGAWAAVAGLVALVAGAAGAFTELRRALNTIGHVTPRPAAVATWLRERAIGLALVLGFGALAVVSLLLSAGIAAIGQQFGWRLGLVAPLFALGDTLVSTTLLVLAFAALLRWLPDRPPSRRALWAGALCSGLLFAIGKHLIGLYLAHAGIASAYGAAGSFVVVMLWVYYSSQILLFGAALAASIDERGTRSPALLTRPRRSADVLPFKRERERSRQSD